MIAAMEFVEDGNGSINQAATVHGVPKSTLNDRLSGRVQHGSKPGPEPYFSKEEEVRYPHSCKNAQLWVMGRQDGMY